MLIIFAVLKVSAFVKIILVSFSLAKAKHSLSNVNPPVKIINFNFLFRTCFKISVLFPIIRIVFSLISTSLIKVSVSYEATKTLPAISSLYLVISWPFNAWIIFSYDEFKYLSSLKISS